MKLRRFPRGDFFAVGLLGLLALSSWSLADEVLIQTTFSEAAAGKPFVRPMDPPLTGPSEIKQGATVSRITIGTKPLDGLQPPYALFEERIKPDSKSIETLRLNWDLKELGYSDGVYELTYRLMVVSESLGSGARMMIELGGSGGTPLKLGKPLYISARPAQVYVIKDAFRPAAKGLRVSSFPGEIRKIKIVLDLDKKEWQSFVDGEELTERTPFPEPLLEVDDLEVQGVSFGSTSSMGTQALSAYAIADVVLKRVGGE